MQALHWLRDMLPTAKDRIFKQLLVVLRDPDHEKAIENDLRGLAVLPEWLQEVVRELLAQANDHHDRVHAIKGQS